MTALPPGNDWTCGRNVSRETEAALSVYAGLLCKWTRRINLVSHASLSEVWTRHFGDSVQVFDATGIRDGDWLDLGSGAGFPGMVVAILARDEAPGLRVACIESDRRKAAFLRSVSRETSVAVEIIDARIEDVPPRAADVVSARALAPLALLCSFAQRHLAPGGVAIFPKGARHADEIEAARAHWRFSVVAHPSRFDPQAAILKIGDLARV